MERMRKCVGEVCAGRVEGAERKSQGENELQTDRRPDEFWLSGLEQTVSLAPITPLSRWAFLLLLSDFRSGLARAYDTDRHRWGHRYVSPKTYCRLPRIWTFWNKIWTKVECLLCRCAMKPRLFSFNSFWSYSYFVACIFTHLFSKCFFLWASHGSTESTTADGGGFYWKWPLEPIPVPGRHSITPHTAGNSSQTDQRARRMGTAQSGAYIP